MIVLGKKYKFTKFERLLFKRKKIHLNVVRYDNKNPKEVLKIIEKILKKTKIKIIVLNTKYKVDDEIIKYLTNLQFVHPVKIISLETFMEKYLCKCYIPDEYTDLSYLENIKTYNFFQYVLKRIIDYVGVFALFLCSSPIIIYSRKKIKKESPGTSMFKQKRVGKNGKIFKCSKFRSMHLNSYYDPYTRKEDARVFPWGVFMRKTRIDELPQMVNVLRGDMHFIGPRAEWDILVDKYEKKIPYYNERHLVRPGITGWAQVNYPYGVDENDAKQKLMYDLYYIKHWSILLEFKVIWKTIMIVLKKRGI